MMVGTLRRLGLGVGAVMMSMAALIAPLGQTARGDTTPGATSIPSAAAVTADGAALPVLAYYYIWFDPSSWQRAKSDTPLGGTYSSDEISVMRRQVRLAKAAGIDGFLVSWKDTPVLSSRLAKLVTVATEEKFTLGIVYQGLDFARRPLAVSKVASDLKTFAADYATNPVFDIFGKPIVIITGTGQFTLPQLTEIITPVNSRLTILASAKSVEEYRTVAPAVAGNAYYWGAANPEKSWYPKRLTEMADEVHASKGLWLAPVAPGFDARLVGGSSVVGRAGGETLRKEFQAALSSRPDAIGIISWNEYSENTHIEPSTLYQDEALTVVAEMTGAPARDLAPVDSSTATATAGHRGLNGVTALLLMIAVLSVAFVASRWRRAPADPEMSSGPDTGPMKRFEA